MRMLVCHVSVDSRGEWPPTSSGFSPLWQFISSPYPPCIACPTKLVGRFPPPGCERGASRVCTLTVVPFPPPEAPLATSEVCLANSQTTSALRPARPPRREVASTTCFWVISASAEQR